MKSSLVFDASSFFCFLLFFFSDFLVSIEYKRTPANPNPKATTTPPMIVLFLSSLNMLFMAKGLVFFFFWLREFLFNFLFGPSSSKASLKLRTKPHSTQNSLNFFKLGPRATSPPLVVRHSRFVHVTVIVSWVAVVSLAFNHMESSLDCRCGSPVHIVLGALL